MKATSERPRVTERHTVAGRLLPALISAVVCMLVGTSLAQAQCGGEGLGTLYPPADATGVSRTTPLVNDQALPDMLSGQIPTVEPGTELLFEAGTDTWVRAQSLSMWCPVVFLPAEPLKPNQRYEFKTLSGEAYNPFVTGEEEGGPALSIQVGPDLDPSEMLEIEVESSRPVVMVLLNYSYPRDPESAPSYRSGPQVRFVPLESGRLRTNYSVPEDLDALFVGVEGQVTEVSVTNDRPPEETEADSDDEGGCTCGLCRTRQRSLSWGVLAAMGLVLTARRWRRGRW
jgi:hypothetical protein